MSGFTREELYPAWADLSARADRARAAYRAGGAEEDFRKALKNLGFDWTGIQLEVGENRPRSGAASLFEVTVKAVDRAARCFVSENPQIDPSFWETLYGPFGDGPADIGMMHWDIWDCDYD